MTGADRRDDFALLLRLANVGEVDIDVTRGLMGIRSPEYRQLHGLPEDKASEPHAEWLERVHPDDRVTADAALKAALAGAAGCYDNEYRIVRPSDGETRTIRARCEIERDADGRAVRLRGVHLDVTDQRNLEAALRGSEERQAFLLKLSDALRPLVGARDIQRTATRLLGERLGADRVHYVEASEAEKMVFIDTGYAKGAPATARLVPAAAFPPEMIASYYAGATFVISDAATAPGVRQEAFAEAGARSLVGVPLRKGDRLVAGLGVHSASPRDWTPSDIALIEQVAERTWAAVERARAEAALRDSEERWRQFGEFSANVLWIVNAQTRQLEYLSPAFDRIFGMPRDALMADLSLWQRLVHPDDIDGVRDALSRTLAGEATVIEYRIVRPSDGQTRWVNDSGFPLFDEQSRVVRAAGIVQDVTAHRHAELGIRDSELRFRTLSEGMPQLVWRAGRPGEWTWASPQWIEFTGQSDADSHGWGWLDPVHPDDREAARAGWERARETGNLAVDYRLRRASDGRHLWFQTRAAPVRDEGGAIVEWLGTSTDVDDIQQLRAHEQLLRAELQHRVRNTLAVVRSIARRTAGNNDSLENFQSHFDGRLSAFARTQAYVTHDPARGVDLATMIADELLAHQTREGERATVAGPEVRLRPATADMLGLALHELATNAVKYGALGDEGGRLDVQWSVDNDALRLTWRERLGAARLTPPTRRGFGTEILEKTLPYQLDATVQLDYRPEGLSCKIEVPLAG